MITGFDDCLQYSFGESQKFDEHFLLDHIKGSVKVEKTSEDIDREGIDYVVYLRNGSKIYVDAKTRKKGASKYWKHGEPEVCLEIYSVVDKKKTGWSLKEDSNVDYILYTFDKDDSDKCYFVPFQLLRMAFRNHFYEWIDTYSVKYERTKMSNCCYTSSCIFVPVSILIGSITELMTAIPNCNN